MENYRIVLGELTNVAADGLADTTQPSKLPNSASHHRNSKTHDPSSYFYDSLKICGITLSENQFLCNDCVLATQALQDKFFCDEGGATLFVKGLESTLDEDDCDELIRGILLPLRTPSEAEENSNRIITGGKESLMKVLISVSCLQKDMIHTFLELFVSKAAVGADGDGDIANDIPRMLLLQLRWLEFVVDEESLADEMLECLATLCSLMSGGDGYIGSLKRDLIGALPEVVTDKQHPKVVNAIRNIMESERDMTVPAIESMAQLKIPPSMMNELRVAVVQILRSAPLEDLPVAIRFLLDSLGNSIGEKSTRENIIAELREKLSEISQELQSRPTAAVDDNTLAILKALHNCLLVRRDIAQTYFHSISTLAKNKDNCVDTPLCVMDFWLLIALRGSLHYEQAVTKLLKKHVIETKAINSSLIEKGVVGQRIVLEYIFKELQNFAAYCLQARRQFSFGKGGSKVLIFEDLGRLLYRLLFTEFADAYIRQEIIHSLVVHCGGGEDSKGETETALRCLRDLVNCPNGALNIRPYIEFIKSLTYNAHRLDPEAIRILFQILGKLSDADDWLHITLRKLLTSCSDQHRMVGLIGAVQVMTTKNTDNNKIGNDDNSDNDDDIDAVLLRSSRSEFDSCSSPNVENANAIFEMTLRSCRSSPLSMIQLFNELGGVIKSNQLDLRVVKFISEDLGGEFETRFVSEIPSDGASNGTSQLCFGGSLHAIPWFNLDEGDSDIALNILPMLSKAETDPRLGDKLLYMCPLFKCVMACDGALENCDALLGCPILLPTTEECQNINPGVTGDAVCLALFYTVNWLRETINNFAFAISNEELRDKICARLRNIIQAENMLADSIMRNPHFVLPNSFVNIENYKTVHTEPKGKGKQKKKFKIVVDKSLQDSQSEELNPSISLVDNVSEKDKTKAVERIKEKLVPLEPVACRLLTCKELSLNQTPLQPKNTLLMLRHLLTCLYKSICSNDIEKHIEILVEVMPFVRLAMDKMVTKPDEIDEQNSTQTSLDSPITDHSIVSENIELICNSIKAITQYKKFRESQESRKQMLLIFKAFDTNNEHEGDIVLYCGYVFTYFMTLLNEGSNVYKSLSTILILLETMKELSSLQAAFEKDAKTDELNPRLKESDAAEQQPLSSRTMQCQMSKVTGKILNAEWPKAKITKRVVENLVNIFLTYSENSLSDLICVSKDMEYMVSELHQDRTFQLLNKKTFAWFYGPAMKQLVVLLRSINTSSEDSYETLKVLIEEFKRLVSLTKILNKRPVLHATVKNGKDFLVEILKKFDIFDIKENKSDVTKSIKCLQFSTRQLQNIISHIKMENDSSMIFLVPLIKKNLETLIFKVKNLLNSNDMVDSFWHGTLKPRNIDGSLLELPQAQNKRKEQDSSESDDSSSSSEADSD